MSATRASMTPGQPTSGRRTTNRMTTNRAAPALALVAKIVVALLLAYFLVWPLVMLLVGSLRSSPLDSSAVWSTAGFERSFTDPNTLTATLNSLGFALASTAFAMVMAVYFATLSSRADIPLRRFITPMMVLLAVTPRLLYAMAWTMLGSPGGVVVRGATDLGLGSLAQKVEIYSWPGFIFVGGLKVTGFAYLLILGAVRRMDWSLEDAAVMSGSSRRRAFFSVSLPVLAPTLLTVGMLVFVEELRSFEIPAIIGEPAGITTLPLHIYYYLFGDLVPDYMAAAALSVVFVAAIALLLVVQAKLLGGRSFTTVTGKSGATSPLRLGWWKPWMVASIAAFVMVAILAPFVQIVIGSLQPFFGVWGTFTFRHYSKVLESPELMGTLGTTLMIGFIGGGIVAFTAFALTYAMQRSRGLVRYTMQFASWVPLMAPGIVLSLALFWAYLTTPGVRGLFGSPWLLLIAIAIAALPIAVRGMEGVVAQIGPGLEEAARMSGSGRTRSIIDITVRIALPSIFATWFLVGLVMAGMLDVVLLLQSRDAQTVPTVAFASYASGRVAEAAALYCIFIVAVLAITMVVALIPSIARRSRSDHLVPAPGSVAGTDSADAVLAGAGDIRKDAEQ